MVRQTIVRQTMVNKHVLSVLPNQLTDLAELAGRETHNSGIRSEAAKVSVV